MTQGRDATSPQRDVGFAIGTGTDVAIESADVVLLQGSLLKLGEAMALSRLTVANIQQNLLGAFIYNTIGIPVAAGLLYPLFGVLLSPMLAGAAMAMSSFTVVSNANRLRWISLEKQPDPFFSRQAPHLLTAARRLSDLSESLRSRLSFLNKL